MEKVPGSPSFPSRTRRVPRFVFSLQKKGRGALVISAMLDFLTFSLCAPHSETTDGKCFEQLLQMVADMGRSIFKLFQVRRVMEGAVNVNSVTVI